MQKMNFYQPIAPIQRPGSRDLNELKVSVRYDKGGINYFTYKNEKRGVYVYFTPVHRESGMESCTLLGSHKESGFKVFAKELGRKSQKQLDGVAQRIEPMVSDFAQKWNADDFNSIVTMVQQAM